MKSESSQILEIERLQREFCEERGTDFVPSPLLSKCGLARATVGRIPINGLRHPIAGDSNGWYIWCGEEYSERSDFFAPVHAVHVYDEQPELTKLLGLPPGYRFLIAGEYLDVWFDPKLLEV